MANRKAHSNGSIHRKGWVHFTACPAIQAPWCTSGYIALCVRTKYWGVTSLYYRGKIGQGHFSRSPTLKWGTTNTIMCDSIPESRSNHYILFFFSLTLYILPISQKLKIFLPRRCIPQAAWKWQHVSCRSVKEKDHRTSSCVFVACLPGCSVPQAALALRVYMENSQKNSLVRNGNQWLKGKCFPSLYYFKKGQCFRDLQEKAHA